jgi:isopenicillin N synthase-like dioxygenase
VCENIDTCRNVGFINLLNHGISSSLIERVYEEKMKLYIGSCSYRNNRCYTLMFEKKLSLRCDLKEGNDLAIELSVDDKNRMEREPLLYEPDFWLDNLEDHFLYQQNNFLIYIDLLRILSMYTIYFNKK